MKILSLTKWYFRQLWWELRRPPMMGSLAVLREDLDADLHEAITQVLDEYRSRGYKDDQVMDILKLVLPRVEQFGPTEEEG